MVPLSAFWKYRGLLFLAALPIVWMLAAPHVTYIHYWFQYRSIALSFWSAGVYCISLFEDNRKRI